MEIPDRQELVSPGEKAPHVVAFDGARVVVPPGAVTAPASIGVSGLVGGEVPRLDAGMTNVTGAPRAGFRFTPHPMQFAGNVEVTLPYDPKLLPSGMTVDDIYTYFFDDGSLCWKPLERKSVDKTRHTVTSVTNHFTDFINTTVTVPESAENVSFNPNQIKGIEAADPGAGITLLAPPGANSQGTNDLGYPIEVPPGRLGVAPQLSVAYSSAGGDGWLGVGWDLSVPAITVDTRWGVPRYDAAKETETYLLGGEQLTPVADRGAPVARAAERVFHARVEGDFSRIVRHGASPSSYRWEVTDKAGMHFFYGALSGASGPDAGQTLSGSNPNGSGVFVWPLREVRDTHGNFMRFTYVKQTDTGLPDGVEAANGFNLYPQEITYTGSGSSEGRYKVTFKRDRDLGEPARVDKQIDARGGFKRVTADLLRRVDVTFRNDQSVDELVRRYELSYVTGAFGKTLLSSIKQTDSNGATVGRHDFGYFDDVRSGGSYTGFADAAAWTVPGDSLGNGKLNAVSAGSGNASVLNANSSTTAGGHVFIGAGVGGVSKSLKAGVKVGFTRATSEGLVALVDVDGDNLPDKVFRTGDAATGFTFFYRKNLAKPGGQPAFSGTKVQLNLPSIGRESSNTWISGIEGYASVAAAQLDRVHVSASTGRYFSDVNDDGIADLVDGPGVWFGRLGADGTPTYGLNDSAATGVRVAQRAVDTGVLGNLVPAPAQLVDANPLADSVRRWIAPYDGNIAINAPMRLADATKDARAASKTADGVRAAIQLNDGELGSVDIGPNDNDIHMVVPSTQSVTVHRGDKLYFRVGSKNDGSLDQVDWNPLVGYLNLDTQNTVDENGLPTREFHASDDFTLGGRATQVKAPLTGMLHLSGDVVKAHATSDDVSVVVTRDGASVFEQTIPAPATGSTPISADVAVQQGQVLKWRLKIDSPVDLGALSWVPRADYTQADGLGQVTDDNGDPLVSLFPAYDVDMYPDDGGFNAPRDPFKVTEDGDYTIRPDLSFPLVTDPDAARPSGTVVFTVKRRNELVGKRTIQISNGVVPSVDPVMVHEDLPDPQPEEDPPSDELFFDYSTRDAGLRAFMPSPSVDVSKDGGDPVGVTAVFRTPLAEGAFPQPYRGWSVVGYNSAGRVTAPIVQSDLVVDEAFADQFPDPEDVDPQGQKDDFEANGVDVPNAFPFTASPKDGRWAAGGQLWANATGASSSRLGADSVALPSGPDFDGAFAVSRISRSTQTSLTGSVAVAGGSRASGDSVGQVDFLDLNGDGFPDVVSGGGIQYTDADGGLGVMRGDLPDGAVRSNGNTAGNFGLNSSAANAGSSAQITPTGRGDVAPKGQSTANTAHDGNTQQPFGAPLSVGEDIGSSDSDAKFDLLDVNGDGLPDRVYADGGVRLNFGYEFGGKEQWRSPTPTADHGAPLNDGSGTTEGIKLGFNVDFYSFAGGVSYSQNHNGTKATLADVNGDGLLDRVFDGEPIMVGFNTGNGFEAPVPFGNSQVAIDSRGSVVGSDQNTSLGGGAYGTFSPFCFGVCVVVNPGADVSSGVSRSVQTLRDVNGDGFADHVISTGDDDLIVSANQTGRTNLLKSVDLPLGGQMDFDYTRDGNTSQLPQSRWVLSRVTTNDGRPGDGQDVSLSTFEYAGGVYDRAEREFDGYATVTTRQRDAGNNDAVLHSITSEFRVDGHYTRGLPIKTTITDAAGRKFTETENSYTLVDVDNPGAPDPHSATATVFPQLTRTDQRFYEGEDTAGKTTFTTMEYDQVGNVTRTVTANETGTADDVDTRVHYSVENPACANANITGAATSIDVFGGGVPMRHRESTIDCATGDVTQVRQTLLGPSPVDSVTDLEYFVNGNLKKVTYPQDRGGRRYFESYAYDPTVDTYVVSVDDVFGLHSSSAYDFRLGVLTSSTDVNNQTVSYTYDAAGRQTSVVSPYEQGGSDVTIRFEYHPDAATPHAISKHIDRQADGTVRTDTIDTITFVDGWGRVIQTKADAAVSTGPATPPADVMVVSGRVDVDALGRAVKTFYPITEPKGPANTTLNPAFDDAAFDTVQPTVTTFDVLDRPTSVVLPDDTTTTMSYGFGTDRDGVSQFETIATDANGKTARSYTDVRGLTTAVKQFNPAGGQNVIWTSYGYDQLGQQTSIVDDHNNGTFTEYDSLGRRTSVTSPDSGRTDFVYDPAGDLIKKKNTKTVNVPPGSIDYFYDHGRLTGITYPRFVGNNVFYSYGIPGAANNAAGRITQVVDGAGRVTRKYGPLGEVTSETRIVTSGNKTFTFTTGYQFDSFNRVLNLTYPDGEVLSYHYDSGGQVDRASGLKQANTYNYLTRLDYDKFGQQVLVDTGTGARTTYTYNSQNQRLDNLKANIAQGYMFQNLNYTYDNVGNITQIQNNTLTPPGSAVGAQVGGPSSQTFTYDDLDRLTHAEGSYTPAGKTDTYIQDIAYDSISNITSKNQNRTIVSNGQTTIDAKLTYNNAYSYGTAGRPHQATTIGAFTFGYDGNGNQISRLEQSGPKRQLIWDEENRLACVHENVQGQNLPQSPASCQSPSPDARFFYDDQGNRIVKDSSSFHIYPNQNYSTNGSAEFKHVYIGATKLLTKQVEANRVEDLQFYSHGDNLGSTGFVTDSAGELAEHLQYIPGGETWVDENSVQPVPHQYTGKELDPETGLYYYGARYYDPKFAAWQSPDPALPDNATDTTSLSAYLYAAGNPINQTDPDGRQPKTAQPGKATVYYNPNYRGTEHLVIKIEVGGQSKIVQQVAQYPAGGVRVDPETGLPNFDTKIDRLSGGQLADFAKNAEAYQFDLENGTGAFEKAKGLTKLEGGTGTYSPKNTCARCVADILEAGGKTGIPRASGQDTVAWVKANGRRIGGGTVRLGSGLGAFAGKVGRFVGLLGFITGLSGDAVYYKELAERAKANGVDMREQGRRESEELRRRGKIWMPGLGAQDDVTIDPKIRKALQGLDTIN